MKKILFCLLSVGLVMGIATFASAGVEAGSTTLSLSATYTNIDVPDIDEMNTWMIGGQVALGRFLTENFQLEGILNGTFGELGDGEVSAHYGAILLRPNFHFSTQTATVPYIGAAAGVFFVDIDELLDETSFIYGAQAGIKQFVRDNVFVQVEGSYLRTEVESNDVNFWRVYLGLGFKL